MKSFAAIDFETANQHRTSVCSVGIVIVREDRIVDKLYRLIRPTPNFYTSWTTRIHGLTSEDTDEAPIFPEVWEELDGHLRGLPLVAHNKSFDETCLKAVFAAYGMDYPEYSFYCTCQTARTKLRDLIPNYQLPTVVSYLGCTLLDHHNALADAEACAEIALKIVDF